MIRVLLVDDHIMIRSGLERLLEQTEDIDVIGVAERGQAAIDLWGSLVPDVVVMDISMPDLDGIETTRRLLAAHADAKVVMLTAHTDQRRVLDAIDAGAVGYLVKDSDPTVLIEGIRAAAKGESPVDPRAAKAMISSRSKVNEMPLSDREVEVLALVAQGEANKAIARRLQISEKTVKAHLTRVFSQIGVSDRTQAAIWARDRGIGV